MMKSVVVVFAGNKIGFKYEKVFEGKSAFEKVIDWSCKVKDSVQTVVLCNKENLPFVNESLQNKNNISIVEDENWTNACIAKYVSESINRFKADFAVFAWGDTPFINKKITDDIIESHIEYKAEYTFADGFCGGLTVEAIDKGAAAIISCLANDSQKEAGCKNAERNAFFSIMSGDINSFEIETILSDKDYRMLRYEFECTSKSGYESCKKLFDESINSTNDLSTCDYDIYKVSDLAESLASIKQTLPAFYNIQISNSYNTKSIYCPYDKVFGEKKLPLMDIEKFSILAKKISEFSGEAVVSLSLFGEPSLNPDFIKIIKEILKYKDLKVFVETDGLNITKEVLEDISNTTDAKSRIYFTVQLDAAEKTMYEKINGISGEYFEKAKNSIGLLNTYFPGQVYPQFTRMNANEEQLESFFRFWKEKDSPSGGQLLIVKYDSFAQLLSDEKPADLSPLERNECWHIRRDMNILSDGSVVICRTRADEIVGNVFSDDLEKIWKKITPEVQNHIEKKYCEKCKACDEYYTFNF